MTSKALLTVTLALVATVTGWVERAESAVRLDAKTICMALKTANPAEIAYITYVCALTDQGYLSTKMLDSTFQWARRTPYPKRVQYFKNALITQAAKRGIHLPRNVPPTVHSLEGRAMVKILVIELPAANVKVTIDKTDLSTTTDKDGRFSFSRVPYGVHLLTASGMTIGGLRSGTAMVGVPGPPPSIKPARVEIQMK